jgi:hypothetical protein
MPANLVSPEDIPRLAARIDSPTLLRALRRLRHVGFIMNNGGVDQETAAALGRLTELGLADPGYEGDAAETPFLWVSNLNGERVLKHLEATVSPRLAVHPRARTALASLPAAERDAVLATVEVLLARDPASWSRKEVSRVTPDKSDYLARVTPELRAFIRVPEAGSVELVDVVPEDTLRLFLERYGTGSKVG